ncbi:hypothetical protein [Rhizobium leguminosarum]|uniref:hypothetical protein n=1 Tax=Rhizobium leguminosarum TaxID=384 RepID=UPI003F9A92D2
MKVFSIDEGDNLIDFDINSLGKVSCLLRDRNGNAFVTLGDKRLPLPGEWQKLVVGIRWRNHAQCFLWAISYPTEGHSSSVGIIDEESARKIKLSTPMLIFTSEDWVICSDSEVVVSEELNQGNPCIFSAYSSDTLEKKFCFGDMYDVSAHDIYFSQIEMGIISKRQQNFWFVADDTRHLWVASLVDRTYRMTKIDIGLDNILCLSCDESYCYLVAEVNKTYMAFIYSAKSCSLVSMVPLETIIGNSSINGFVGAETLIWRGHDGSVSIAGNGVVENFPIFRQENAL